METLKDCRDVEVSVGDFVIYVVQGNRNAGVNFGYIYDLKDKRTAHTGHDGQEYVSGDIAVKIQHADAEGNRKNVQVVDVEGHWRGDTPQIVLDYDRAGYYDRDNVALSWEGYYQARQTYWINSTLKDSGKPSTTTIRCSGGTEHRLLKAEPYV